MYNTLLFGAITASTISVVSVGLLLFAVKDINTKIDRMTTNVQIKDAEPVSNISYAEWLKNKIITDFNM